MLFQILFLKMNSDTFDSEAESNNTFEDEYESKTSIEEPKISNLDLIRSITKTLTMILEENKNLINYNSILQKQSKIVFNADSIPNISIYDYLIRIQKYSGIERSSLIIALIYIDRICEIGHLTLTYYNIHRILFVSIIMAIKYNEDSFYDNKYYSEIAGIPLKELNMLENTFVEMCHFKLFVFDEIVEHYCRYLNTLESNN